MFASVVSVLTVTAATADFLTSASDTFTVKSLPFASVDTYLPSPTMLNVSSLRFTTPADVLVSPENFKLTASVVALAVSATAFNWSSVAARPVVAVPFQVVLDKPVTCLLSPSIVTPPIAAFLAVILPVAPSSLIVSVVPSPTDTLVKPARFLFKE